MFGDNCKHARREFGKCDLFVSHEMVTRFGNHAGSMFYGNDNSGRFDDTCWLVYTAQEARLKLRQLYTKRLPTLQGNVGSLFYAMPRCNVARQR